MYKSAPGSVLGGFETTPRGAGAFGWIDPPYTDAGLWATYIRRFRPGESTTEKIEAPDMLNMQALTLSGYNDIWFSGKPYGPDQDYIIVNYYYGKWFFYADPTPYGMNYLHLFSHTNGWGFDENRIYRFDGQRWTLWLELAAFQSIEPCDIKSQKNVWAVGSYADKSRSGNVVLHYNGAAWEEAFTPGENKYVYDVSMYNNANGWAVGAEKVGTKYYGRMWQCLNGVWLERVCPVEEGVGGVEVVSKTEAWALNSRKIFHYKTESTLAPTSLGRLKAAYAAPRGFDAGALPPAASPKKPAELPPVVPAAPKPASPDRTAAAEGPAD